MLLFWTMFYLLFTILLGIYASRFVKSSGDFILAGRKLPFSMATATVFATWFGSETILGASVEFANHGMQGVIEEPFGAALGLIIVGLFFARQFYRKNFITFGDFYREQFGKKAESIAAIMIVFSYFGWIAAQMVAMGTVIHMITGINMEMAIAGSSLLVTFYTWIGGLWAVSLTDSLQMIIIITGLFIATWFAIPDTGFMSVIEAAPDGFLNFFPNNTFQEWIVWTGALLTLGLGSVPQQDVFQRVMASKTEKIAVYSSITAGILYLTIALIPLYLGLVAKQTLSGTVLSQNLILEIIKQKTPLTVQIIFMGALLSAIMSTASGALLAPSSIMSENIIKPLWNKNIQDELFLKINRLSVVGIAFFALIMALYRRNIYDLVAEASAVSLVSLFVPLVSGLFFKNKNETAAILSMVFGIFGWLLAVYLETGIPAIFYGLATSSTGFTAGIMYKKFS